MSFFSKIFNISAKSVDPEIQFGRFTDSYKEDEKYQCWNKSIDYFENEKYMSSYAMFFDFLCIDGQKNVQYTQSQGKISFTIYQGSKIIYGDADFARFRAEARIVKSPKPNLGLMRLLLEENFDLKYTRYSIDEENCICLKFDTYVEDGSPHKIYQALKELATQADGKDDVLIHNFDELIPINFNHTRQISTEEKKVKFEFFTSNVQKVLHEIDHGKLNTYLYPGGISYLLLDFLYKIDFLIKPEGTLMEVVRACNELYFTDNMTSVHDKNKEMIRMVRHLEKTSFDEFEKELYEVNSTFGMSMPEGHRRLAEIIDAQMNDFDWYYENKYFAYANGICGYVVGYSLYSYSLPEPSKDLLKLFYSITENNFFHRLGFGDVFTTGDVFHKNKIQSAIASVVLKHSDRYPGIKINHKMLQYDNSCLFSKSFLMMVRHIEYPED